MSYIGNPIVSTDFPKDTFSGNGSTTAFTMSIAPASVNAVIVAVSGVVQDPSTYTISGTTLTFSGAPPSGTSNISVRHLGVAGIPNTPSAASVTPSSLASGYALWNLSGSDVNYTAGNVGVGTASPATKLSVSGADTSSRGQLSIIGASDTARMTFYTDSTYNAFLDSDATDTRFGTVSSTPLLFLSNSTERMQITSAGRIITTGSANNDNIFLARNSNATPSGIGISFTGGSPNNTSQYAIEFGDSNAYRFRVWSNGNVVNSNNSYGSISDAKLKENVVDTTPKLDKLMDVKVRNYNLIGETTKQIGVVAQELETVFPSMIDVSPDTDAEGKDLGTTTKSVKYSVFVPILLKAIQELNTKVDAQAIALAAQAAEIQALKDNSNPLPADEGTV